MTRSTGISGLMRLDHRPIAAWRSHRRQIDHGGNAREILQHNAGGHEGDLDVGRTRRAPTGEILHVVLGDDKTVTRADRRLDQHSDRVGNTGQVP